MSKPITSFVGLDVHQNTVAVAVASAGREEPRFVGTVAPQWGALSKALGRLGRREALEIVYEAGPCGYTLARRLRAQGYRCNVIAPAKVPRRPGDRIKTDRRDALLLARAARAGELVSVTIPDERDEALRDLTRAREDAVRARLKVRQQLKAMLLRHGHRYTGRSSWTAAHERYLAEVSFAHPAQDIAYAEYRSAVREAHERVERLSEAMRGQLEHWRMRPVVEALMCLRGIDLTAAMTLVAEVGDFTRFARPRELMGFLGLVPSEYTSGDKRQQGEITKTGNSHARRILVEAAWNYRFPARQSAILQRRQENQPKWARDIAWRAQLRLARRFRHLSTRKLVLNKICVAVARELSGFVWDIARKVKPVA
ncbi:MAG: IS110 family transposase [Steroidobacteraceae bacterium]